MNQQYKKDSGFAKPKPFTVEIHISTVFEIAEALNMEKTGGVQYSITLTH